ncbi:hypothetical protein MMC07_002534 [Pseudocyphellaria aurata]|nr:hypothetical protein [Pseudocyphellaria aurata]
MRESNFDNFLAEFQRSLAQLDYSESTLIEEFKHKPSPQLQHAMVHGFGDPAEIQTPIISNQDNLVVGNEDNPDSIFSPQKNIIGINAEGDEPCGREYDLINHGDEKGRLWTRQVKNGHDEGDPGGEQHMKRKKNTGIAYENPFIQWTTAPKKRWRSVLQAYLPLAHYPGKLYPGAWVAIRHSVL